MLNVRNAYRFSKFEKLFLLDMLVDMFIEAALQLYNKYANNQYLCRVVYSQTTEFHTEAAISAMKSERSDISQTFSILGLSTPFFIKISQFRIAEISVPDRNRYSHQTISGYGR